MRVFVRFFLFLGLLASLAVVPAAAESIQPVSALAMHGTPKYPTDFTHFGYVNPDAPQGGTLRMGVVGTFDSLHPFIVRGQPALGLSLGYMAMVYESLMARGWDEPFTLYSLIAQSVEVPEDRSSIIFNLRPEAHWQDGKPITADDVLFSYVTLRDKGRPNNRMYYKKVERAEKLSERRVLFVFKRNADGSVDREMPLIMGLMPILPKHDWEGRDFNQTTLRPPVGSGPYKVEKVDVGRSITYKRDPAYWGKDVPAQQGLYNFDTVRIDYYRDDSIALQAFKAGQYDLRRENDPKKWAAAYDVPAVREGRLVLQAFPHRRTEAINGFIFNTRRDLFKDETFRKALSFAFDFGWINKHLFQGVYKRSESFFPNSELATRADELPQGEEKEILEKYADLFPKTILERSVDVPTTDGTEESLRRNLLQASDLLKEAGYRLKDGILQTPQGTSVAFEVLLSDPMEEKVALQWTRALSRLGITARVRTVDSAQYQARLAGFDYDVVVGKWTSTLSPGNEQMLFWGSRAATQQGSRNYAGIQDPAVDALAAAIPAALTRAELVGATRALDRVLLAGYYVVPFYHAGSDRYAFWRALRHPDVTPLYGPVVESWWRE